MNIEQWVDIYVGIHYIPNNIIHIMFSILWNNKNNLS